MAVSRGNSGAAWVYSRAFGHSNRAARGFRWVGQIPPMQRCGARRTSTVTSPTPRALVASHLRSSAVNARSDAEADLSITGRGGSTPLSRTSESPLTPGSYSSRPSGSRAAPSGRHQTDTNSAARPRRFMKSRTIGSNGRSVDGNFNAVFRGRTSCASRLGTGFARLSEQGYVRWGTTT